MHTSTLLFFLLGVAFLILGAEFLVRGASRLAASLGIPPLVIGLTVVAFGTGSPELAVSIQSGMSNQASIALGNVVGSNILNVLCVLGISALTLPMVVAKRLLRMDVPIMIGVSCLLYLLALDGQIGRWDGLILFAGFIIYIVVAMGQRRKARPTAEKKLKNQSADGHPDSERHTPRHLFFILLGLTLLILGSNWMVESAVAFAQALGISELVIALTIVSVGTSLPEIATSLLAGFRGEQDIAVGNIIGSNIFNILSVLGLAGLLTPGGISVPPAAMHFDLPIMIAAALVCMPIFYHDYQIKRWEGALFLGYYLSYTLYLILETAHEGSLPIFNRVMLLFVIPLTVIGLATTYLRAFSRRRRDRPPRTRR